MQITPEEWLLNFMRAGIDCVAVTDHNSGDWVDRLKAALAQLREQQPENYRPLWLFPGVEITANGNIHILAIFDPEKDGADVSALLGAVGNHGNRGESSQAVDASPIEVIQKIVEANALPVLAHVDGPSGAWELGGSTLAPLLECENLFAIEVVSPDSEKPALYHQKNLRWAKVLGSDAHHPSGPDGARYPGSHWTWVKMAQPSLEGLRLALLDGERFSIRRSDDPERFDPNTLPENFIESVAVDDARYMGRGQSETLSFSPWFNALVGGRGTGKSTIVHALRLALRRENELQVLEQGSEPRRTFEKFNRSPSGRDDDGALTPETHVALVFLRDGARYRVHWRPDGSGSVVEEQKNGDWHESDHQAVIPERFPIRLFSQGQIAALAGGSHQALLDLIDEAAGADADKTALREAQQTYLSLCAKARELEGRLQGRAALKIRLQDVQRKLQKFEDAHHADVLKAYQRRSRQEREVNRQFGSAEEMVRRVSELAEELAAEDLPEQLFDEHNEQDQETLAVLSSLHKAIESASKALKDTAEDLAATVHQDREKLPTTEWQQEVVKARSNYERLVRDLKEQGVADPSEYGQLVQERQQLENQWKELESLDAQRARVLEQAESQRETVVAARRTLSERREAFLEESLAGNEYVQISLKPYRQDARAIERSIRAMLGAEHPKFESDILIEEGSQPARGMVAELLDQLPDDANQAREALERRIGQIKHRLTGGCRGHGAFGGRFNNFLERQASNRPELVDHIVMWYPDDGLDVRYSQRGDGRDFKSIEQASAGQRAAAMLAFLLAHGSEPIVLDQPEDDLDNHLIYNLVVRQLRENKQRRQIIAVTHNPNIVVNGDAEMLHALDFRGGQCRVIEKGSLQEKAMRDEVCHVMEGGRDAFERRYRRLGKEL
nr:AAA family ATPase [Halorhodospira abdelmalekii]